MSDKRIFLSLRSLSTALPLLIAILALAALGLSYTGAWFAPGDSLAVGRPNLIVVVTLMALWLWWVRAVKLALMCLLAGGIRAGTLATYYLPAPPSGGPVTLYQKNLLHTAWPRTPLADEILASGADIVTLQEVSVHNRRYMKRLFDAYPAQIICPFRAGFDVAILSRYPAISGTAGCGQNDGLALMQVALPDGQRLWIAALHLYWPWPYSQPEQLVRLLPRLAALEGPIVLAGDFNMVPWGASVARIAKASGTQRIGRAHDTYPNFRPLLSLPIDHVLLPKGSQGRTEMRPLHGSDHHGLFVEFALP